jgi:diguanylate cyclase (GGDEF)-like protein
LLWTVAFVFELLAGSLAAKMLFARVQFIGIVTLPIAWLRLALIHTGRRVHPLFWSAVFSIAIAALVFILFVPTPNLFWGHPSLVMIEGSYLTMDYDYGPLFTLMLMPFTNVMVLGALGLLVHLMMQPHVMYKRQTALIIVATLIPLLMNFLYLFGITPIDHVNFSTATMSLTGLLVGYALFKYRYLELFPIARDIVFEHMNDPVFVLNRDRRIVDVNRAARTLVGGLESLIGMDYATVQSRLFSEPDMGPSFVNEEKLVTIRNGFFDVTSKHVTDARGQGSCTLVLFHDVTERERMNAKIKELGRRDPLTGALNRRELLQVIEHAYHEACTCSSPLSLIMLDLDGFKAVNDTYGHEAGDKALESFSRIMFKIIRPEDSIGRYGGDEFVIVSPGSDEHRIFDIAEAIRSTVRAREVVTKQGSFSLQASLGVHTFRSDGASHFDDPAAVLLSRIDEALYRAKRSGRNRIETFNA